MNMHVSVSVLKTHSNTYRGFYFFFPSTSSSVFPFPLFIIIVVCPPVYFPAPGLSAVKLVVCWYDGQWCPDILTVSSVIRLQIHCWACPRCQAKPRRGGSAGYKYLTVLIYKDGTQNIQWKKENRKQCVTDWNSSVWRSGLEACGCNLFFKAERLIYVYCTLTCALTSGLHYHGPEQRRIHRQERSEGHFCCSRYVDIPHVQSYKDAVSWFVFIADKRP